jgi:hypothetical protein
VEELVPPEEVHPFQHPGLDRGRIAPARG